MDQKVEEHEWEDTWDDEEAADDDFAKQLRAELQKGGIAPAQ